MAKFFHFPVFCAAALAAFFVGCSDASSTSAEDVSSSSLSESQSSSSQAENPSSSSESDASSSNESWRDSCVAIINAYRESVSASSITRNTAKESCTDSQAASDLSENSAHGHFGSCGEFAQNTGPNITTAYYSNEVDIVRTYLDMMWKEKELADAGDTVYMHIGHYLNMKNSQVESVACGIAKSDDGKTAWLNVNFF
ncbi:MAG: CAP domain-containing protein [Fibrobacter sp.]|nr:CAP domain-containing protein [Fibrobacter sp.]